MKMESLLRLREGPNQLSITLDTVQLIAATLQQEENACTLVKVVEFAPSQPRKKKNHIEHAAACIVFLKVVAPSRMTMEWRQANEITS